MIIENKFRLPDTLVNLAERDPYSKGGADYSVTQLIDAPKISYLQEKHDHEIRVDITQNMWSLVGRALHNVCEGGAEDHHIIEERMFMLIDGVTISGAVDVQEILDDKWVNVYDYKFTSVWAVQKQKPDWERQLNMYAQLIRSCKGMNVNQMYIVAIIRDWNRHKVGSFNYPPAPVQVITIKKWSPPEAVSYIRERVNVHSSARKLLHDGKEGVVCNDEDRWKRPDVFAVHTDKSAKATRLFGSEREAEEYVSKQKKIKPKIRLSVVKRPGDFVRCEGNWCMVRQWCDQWSALQKEKA